MTTQDREKILYKNEEFVINEFPFEEFPNKPKDLKFGLISSALWRGYQGTWLLHDNKFFIKDFYGGNYSFEALFGSKEPVLAHWYTGNIEIDINLHNPREYNKYYGFYLLLEVQSGIVINRKIIRKKFIEPKLWFCFYHEYTFTEVLQGKITPEFNTSWRPMKHNPSINNYLNDLIQFYTNPKFDTWIITPDYEEKHTKDSYKHDFRRFLKDDIVEYFLSDNILLLSNKTKLKTNEIYIRKFSKLAEKILTSNFENLSEIFVKINVECPFPLGPAANSSILLNPDIKTLEDFIESYPDFCVPPHLMDRKYFYKKLITFKVKRLNSTIFEYKPIIKEFEHEFSQQLKDINTKKFLEINDLIYDSDNNFYIVNKSQEEMMDEFGYYLDDNTQRKKQTKKQSRIGPIVIESKQKPSPASHDLYDDFENEFDSYEKYSGTYAQDVEDLSDDFIDNALGGEPDAYWNID